MNRDILVCVKTVPSSSDVQVDSNFCLRRDSAALEWNLADESALEAALRLRGRDVSVTVLSMGPPKAAAVLQQLYARGADRVILLSDPALAGADTRATAAALAHAAWWLGMPELILCGRRAIDGETGQIPGELAAALEIAREQVVPFIRQTWEKWPEQLPKSEKDEAEENAEAAATAAE